MIEKIRRIHYGALVVLLLIATVATSVTMPSSVTAYAGGNGTQGSPWQIANCTDLQDLNDSVSYRDDYFILTNDVNCNGVDFTRIMFADNLSFQGHFEGADHKISNVAVNDSVANANGLFGHLENATIVNLTLENITVSGERQTGALAGLSNGASVENVAITSGEVTGIGEMSVEFGGLIGTAYDTSVFNVAVDVDVDAQGAESVGGLVGTAMGASSLEQVVAQGAVEGNSAVGGLAGSVVGSSTFDKAFATGDVVAHTGPGGGFAGLVDASSLADTYARGDVTGSGYLGGLVGYLDGDSSIQRVYATGVVTPQGESIAGGLVGGADDFAIVHADTFWDTDTGNLLVSAGAGEVGKTTTQMKSIATFTDELFDDSWDFDDDWMINMNANDGYPCLRWSDDSCSGSDGAGVVETITTGAVTNITQVGARIHGTAQLADGYTIADMIFNDGDLMLGFHFNTSQPVDWDNYTHTAPVMTVAPIDGDDTHLSFYADYDELGCGTQYWYIAAYDHADSDAIGVANNARSFTTAACDDDSDGVASDIETAAPNDGDGNNDGVPDSEQAYVASLVSPVSRKYVTLTVDESCALSDVSIADASGHNSQDNAYLYQSGFVKFTATGCDEDVANVKLYYHDVSPASMIARKYNPTTNTYFTITSATLTAAPAPLSGVVASYAVSDNGALDINPAVGVIVDPVGLASVVPGTPNTGFAPQQLFIPAIASAVGTVIVAAYVITRRKA